MDYGEELAYWYLRLNGFFPITDFVMHKQIGVKHTSDCDVLALRAPLVHEKIGGRPEDWDQELAHALGFDENIVGLICEVKTGQYKLKNLFRREYLGYAVGRLGLVRRDDIQNVSTKLAALTCLKWDGRCVGKLFVSNDERRDGPFIFRSVNTVEDFIVGRVKRYPAEKYSDRHFFKSQMFQHMIHQVNRARAERQAR